MSLSRTTEPGTRGKELPGGRLVDHPQWGVRPDRLQGVRIDVGTAIHAGSSVFLEQAEPDQPVDGRAADARVGGSLVDGHQFRQIDQILPARATSSLYHCDIGTTILTHCHHSSAVSLMRF